MFIVNTHAFIVLAVKDWTEIDDYKESTVQLYNAIKYKTHKI